MVTRFLAVLISASLAAAGCAAERPARRADDDAPPFSARDEKRPLLEPWGEISREAVFVDEGIEGVTTASIRPFMSPTAVAARHGQVFIVDSGSGKVLRYDVFRRSLKKITGLPASFSTGVYVSVDNSIYVSDPFGGKIMRFNEDGGLMGTYSAGAYISSPSPVAVDETRGMIYTADSVSGRMAVFNKVGQLVKLIGDRGGDLADTFLDISSIAMGAEGIYAADKGKRRVHVLNRSHDYLYSFGADDLQEPVAIAVDNGERVYVADAADNSIKVFSGGKLIHVFGGEKREWVRFLKISGMASDGARLYVADSVEGRVYIFLIMPEGIE